MQVDCIFIILLYGLLSGSSQLGVCSETRVQCSFTDYCFICVWIYCVILYVVLQQWTVRLKYQKGDVN